ncbi:MAG: MXAN_5187 C-terminal domain-containing protein [Kofleriaceae bacterium]
MASKTAQHEPEKAEVIEEALDALDTALDRVKVLYEQYFLGLQKQPPSHLHTDCERKLRDIAQLQIRNTALRYRFATLQQKFGSYNAYWRRTVRQIENGTYARSLLKVGRQAAKSGADIPEEILAAMPKRMREQVRRDREAAVAINARRHEGQPAETDPDDMAAIIKEPSDLQRKVREQRQAHVIDESDLDMDLDAFFASVTMGDDDDDTQAKPVPKRAAPAPKPLRSATDMAVAATRDSGEMRSIREPVRVLRSATANVVEATEDPPTSPIRIPTQPGSPTSPLRAPGRAPPPPPPPGPRPVVTPPMRPAALQPPRPVQQQVRPTGQIGQPPLPAVPRPPPSSFAPSQVTRPNPIAAGVSTRLPTIDVESLEGPFARESSPVTKKGHPAITQPIRPTNPQMTQPLSPLTTQPIPMTTQPLPPMTTQPLTPMTTQPLPPMTTQPLPISRVTPRPRAAPPVGSTLPNPAAKPIDKPAPAPAARPPAGMTDADVNALYAKFVKAKEMVGEKTGPGAYGKLLQTINAQAPKIMEQYKAKGVDFSVVVKDNQVIIRAKPKP